MIQRPFDTITPRGEDLEKLFAEFEPDLDPDDALFKAGVALLADGFSAASSPPWLHEGMFDRVCFKAHLGVSVGILRVVEHDE